jgi:peptidase E
MAKLYFLGGENTFKRDAKEINALAFQDAGESAAVLVFPWARPSFDSSYRRRKKIQDYFRSLGADTVEFSEYLEPPAETSAKVARSNLIYLTGGQLTTLMTRLRHAGVDKLLRDYKGVIVGRSAGALALSRKCLVTSRYSGATRIVDGLNLVDFSVKVHYNPSKDALLREISKQERVYAIPERSVVICRDGVLSFVGRVFLFENGEKQVALNV